MGHEVYLWSSGGGSYAAQAADLLGVADLRVAVTSDSLRAAGR